MLCSYDITLHENIPYGLDIVDKPCSLQFSYSIDYPSFRYHGVMTDWLYANVVQLASAVDNINGNWLKANSGVLLIYFPNRPLSFSIADVCMN